MDEKECLEAIQRGESAYGLLVEHAPDLERRFNRLCKALRDFLDEAQKTFPDAQYYTASGGLNLMLGSPHTNDSRMSPQQELIALSGRGVVIGDGAF